MEFIDVIKSRYATKKFTGEVLSKDKIDQLSEMIRLSASSFGLQPFKVKIIQDKALQEKLQAVSWNQPQVGTASHVLVFCANTDAKTQIDKMEKMVPNPQYIEMMRGWYASKKPEEILMWAKGQTYIAMANAINGAKALGFDSCPMEGFDPVAYSQILDLPKELVPVVVVPVGIAADTPRPKVRYAKEDLFF